MTQDTLTQSPVSVSSSAAARIKAIVDQEPVNKLLRVSVEGGGCSGFQYKFDLVENAEDDDLVIKRDGATVLVDPVSLPFLAGSEIDFVQELIGASFKVTNPNATASCGCGTSFSI
jgi:iron-sulfur cluster insertion protein